VISKPLVLIWGQPFKLLLIVLGGMELAIEELEFRELLILRLLFNALPRLLFMEEERMLLMELLVLLAVLLLPLPGGMELKVSLVGLLKIR